MYRILTKANPGRFEGGSARYDDRRYQFRWSQGALDHLDRPLLCRSRLTSTKNYIMVSKEKTKTEKTNIVLVYRYRRIEGLNY